MVFTIGVVVPRIARKSTDGSDRTMSNLGARLSAHPSESRTTGMKPAMEHRW
jgi:hypothetical protein